MTERDKATEPHKAEELGVEETPSQSISTIIFLSSEGGQKSKNQKENTVEAFYIPSLVAYLYKIIWI